MTAPNTPTSWAHITGPASLPAGSNIPLAVTTDDVVEHDVLAFDSSGNGVVADGTDDITLNVAGVVYPTKQTGAVAIAATKIAKVWDGFGGGLPYSTAGSDGFTKADTATPAYVSARRELGKKEHSSGVRRLLAGLVTGVDEEGKPIAIVGWLGKLLARAKLIVDAKVIGWYAHPVDGSASTATAEKTIFREPVPSAVTAIYLDTLGTIAADNTDYVTITVYKRDGAGGSAVSIGTYTSTITGNGAVAAGVPASFTLTATTADRYLLSTDILTYAVTKGGAGKVVPVGTLRVIGKVL